jgi:hypothetical protein
MSNLDTLRTAWEAVIDTVSDSILQAEATVLLDEYINAKTTLASLQQKELQSYTVAGRTAARVDIEKAERIVSKTHHKLVTMVYGRFTLVDLNTVIAQP